MRQRNSSNDMDVKIKDDMLDDGRREDDKSGIKQIKALSRVPRACNACRKQKMRCEGADNPPCRRCRHASLECLFEKPTREPNLTGEAGLQRIRALETQVTDVRQSLDHIQNTLSELVHHLRNTALPTLPQSHQPMHTIPPTPSSALPVDANRNIQSRMDHYDPNGYVSNQTTPIATAPSDMGRSTSTVSMRSPQTQVQPGSSNASTYSLLTPRDTNGYRSQGPADLSAARYESHEPSNTHHQQFFNKPAPPSLVVPEANNRLLKRKSGTSTVTSSTNSDFEDDNGELPTKGLIAPWEVLRGLADVAASRAARESGSGGESYSRPRSPTQAQDERSRKRPKPANAEPSRGTFLDVVTKNVIHDHEARDLFKIFYAGCSTFLPVFDSQYDTYDSLRSRSPFAFNAICMVAAKVRDGGGNPSETYRRCFDEVQEMSKATLFAPVTSHESVQAMVLVSGWSDNGWLSGGHAVRMAFELSLHQAWPKLLKRIQNHKASTTEEDRQLITESRTWFCLYLFEHQMSYGTGRPAILRDDESIWASRMLLQHPLAIEDDMRLCSTVELMAIRERIQNKLSLHGPVDERTFTVIQEADSEFRNWFSVWDSAFSQKYENAAFYRQSLQIQRHHAELFHNATALRGIDDPEDVQKMPTAQKALALASLQIAQHALTLSVNSTSYRDGLKYAVHYTHATATFTASFLLRLARIFPDHCDLNVIRGLVERLIEVLSEIPARRYAYTLQLMLKKSKRRKGHSRSPTQTFRPDPQANQQANLQRPDFSRQHGSNYDMVSQRGNTAPSSSANSVTSPIQTHPGHSHFTGPVSQMDQDGANLDLIWKGFEGATNDQLPMWITDQTLGGQSLSQLGLEAFMMPIAEFDQQRNMVPRIW